MKKAIMYGGGNIGRGFIGKVFSDSGYEVCFLDIMQPLTDEMNRRGYVYYDWNVDSGDAQHGSTAESIYQNVISQTSKYEKAIVLMHNSSVKKDTLDQLPRIIEKLQEMGYRFAALDPTVQPINFRLPD